MLLLLLAAVLAVIVPFLGWHETWFGRRLSDKEMDQYLRDTDRPRRIQHALSQIAGRIARGDPAASTWYPRVVEVSRHPAQAIRATAAWVMGQDNACEPFHKALLRLLEDPELIVRRNAALALVRFKDASGRAELAGMLESHLVAAPASGRLSMRLEHGQNVGSGTLLAQVTSDGGHAVEVRSPFPGQIDGVFAGDGSPVRQRDRLVSLKPGPDQVFEALRGLYLIGEADDLVHVEQYMTQGRPPSGRIQMQAAYTAQAIRARSTRTSIH